MITLDSLKTVLDVVGYISTTLVIVYTIIAIYRWIKGITPALYRLGKGLASRKIAIFASGDDYTSLEALLVDSNLFKKTNLCPVTKQGDCGKAEGYSLFLVHWKSAKDHFQDVLAQKKDSTALIVYAPQDEGKLDDAALAEINKHRNAVLVNFRGRLLNDIVTSLITTSYEKN